MSKNKKQKSSLPTKYHNALIISVICILLVFAELILSNSILIKSAIGGYEPHSIKLNNNPDVRQESDGLYIDNIDIPACCVGISAVGMISYNDFQIMMLDENFAYEYQLAGKYRFFCGAKETTGYFKINPAGKLKSLKISVNSSDSNISLSNITINAKPPISFNFFRYVLSCIIICGIFVIIRNKAYNKEYDENNRGHIALLAIVIAVCMLNSIFLNNFTSSKTQTKSYSHPLTASDLTECGLYARQFDAFLDGHLNIDVDLDNARVSALENVYDNSERGKYASGSGLVWDSAYYNGNTYSYFGVAPIIYYYYPYYALTGHIPTEHSASLFLSFFGCLFICLAFIEIVKHYCKKPSLVLMCLAMPAICFSSLIYASQSMANMYNIACLSGILFLALTLFASFKAVHAKKTVSRILLFALAGLGAVSLLASRPISILYCVMLVPLFISYLLQQRENKEKIVSVTAFFVPVAVCGVALMIYNKARFDSPFQFGAIYNITVSDTSKNNIRLFLFFPAIYHMFLQPPRVSGTFPFIFTQKTDLNVYRSYIYNIATVGALSYPITWGIFGSLLSSKGKENRSKRAVIILAVAAAVIIAFLDVCMGGVHLRYETDIMLIMSIIGSLGMLVILEKAKDVVPPLYSKLLGVFCVFCVISALIGGAMAFENARSLILNNNIPAYKFFFDLFNY
ncbi:MAG: hypothetical protein K6F76_00400 [Clostridiales bacterium]|nr:hypothetical protein [Clostridiales bacterium]